MLTTFAPLPKVVADTLNSGSVGVNEFEKNISDDSTGHEQDEQVQISGSTGELLSTTIFSGVTFAVIGTLRTGFEAPGRMSESAPTVVP